MTSAASMIDSLIREYLIFRGFSGTLKQFDADMKIEKEKGFKVDRIVEQLCSFITSNDFRSLRELWEHLNAKVFLQLDHIQSKHADRLEDDLYKLYIANCIQNRRYEKAAEFFEIMGQRLHDVESWKEWFAFYQMDIPSLLSYVVEQRMMKKENQGNSSAETVKNQVSKSLLQMQAPPPDVVSSAEVMDDFYVIAQSSPASDTAGKSLKSVIKKKFTSSKKE